jgi:hypothetical protein
MLASQSQAIIIDLHHLLSGCGCFRDPHINLYSFVLTMPPKRKASEADPSNSTPRPRGRPPKNKQPASTIADDDDDGFEVLPKPPLPKRTRKVIPRAKQAGRIKDDGLGIGR